MVIDSLAHAGGAQSIQGLIFSGPGAVIVVSEEPDKVGGLLAECVRDIVRPADAPRAVEAVLRGKPPVLLERLRAEIEGEFLPKFVEELRQRAKEKQALVDECIDLVRAATHLEERVYRGLPRDARRAQAAAAQPPAVVPVGVAARRRARQARAALPQVTHIDHVLNQVI
jgi:hypothetical protein